MRPLTPRKSFPRVCEIRCMDVLLKLCVYCVWKWELAWPPPRDQALLKYLPPAQKKLSLCPMSRDQSWGPRDPRLLPPPASLSAPDMIRPWWLLLSFSHCNVVFHAFLPDVLDQQYSHCPCAPPLSSPCPFPLSTGLTYTTHCTEVAFSATVDLAEV